MKIKELIEKLQQLAKQAPDAEMVVFDQDSGISKKLVIDEAPTVQKIFVITYQRGE